MTIIAPTISFPTAAEEILFPAGGPNIYTIFPSGGFVLSGAASFARVRAFTVSGGAVFGGTAPIVYNSPNTYTIFPSGGVAFAGAAPQLRTRTFAVSGGFALSGSAAQIRTKFILPSGGVVFSGDAPMLFIPAGGGSVTTSLALMGVGQ